jgi:hypothetical protein
MGITYIKIEIKSRKNFRETFPEIESHFVLAPFGGTSLWEMQKEIG